MSKSNSISQKIKPAKGYLLLEILKNEAPSKNWSAPNPDQIPQRGKVLAVGPDTFHETGDVFKPPAKKGDVVVHSGFGFEDIRVEMKEFRLCPFSKILAVIEE